MKRIRDAYMLLPNLFGWMFFYLVPIIILIILSFMNFSGDEFIGLYNYKLVMSSKSYILSLRNMSIYLILTIPLTVVLGFLIAYLMYDKSFSGWIKLLLLLPMFVPSVAVSGFLRRIIDFVPEIIKESYLIMFFILAIFIWRNLGLTIYIFKFGFDTIEHDVINASKIDGAGSVQIIKSLLIPLSKKYTILNVIILVIANFKIYRDLNPIFSDYPQNPYIYTFQNYLVNVYRKMEFTKMYASTVIILVCVMAFMLISIHKYRESEY